MTGPLAGKRIAVPESRELDLFARMLEEQGAATVRCPLVAIRDLDDPAPAEAWLKRLIAGNFDDLILLTGEGLRRLIVVAQRAGIEAPVIAALGKLRTITRGPKPVRALWILPSKVARAGAKADAVVPYRYATDAETDSVVALINALAAGQIDVIAFTSSMQIERLADVARARGIETQLHDGLAHTKIASIGPIVSAAVKKIGGRVAIAPTGGSFHLKPLVNAIVAALGNRPQ